ncbi:MAG: calcium/sodium antiporter [Planctomycetota bacterium]|jgi:cation:H+ antiporter|nr:calcium/sodium antiporter [Planctomycetota bacterium]
MLVLTFLVALGMAILFAGAEAMVRGSSALALRLGIAPVIVGLTVVSFGTSSPELVIGLDAALTGHGGIAMGNVIGSNICNIALILGVGALVRPLRVDAKLIRWDVPIMIGVSFFAMLLILDGKLGRLEGAILATGIVAYNFLQIRQAKKEKDDNFQIEFGGAVPAGPKPVWVNLALILAGVVLLVFGGHILIKAATMLAKSWGVSEEVIALSMVAFGTSVPELATTLVASLKGEGDIAVGNAIGSNIFNLLGILGVTALVMPFEAPDIRTFDLTVMLIAAIVAMPLMWSGFVLNRIEGGILLFGYAVYIGILFLDK